MVLFEKVQYFHFNFTSILNKNLFYNLNVKNFHKLYLYYFYIQRRLIFQFLLSNFHKYYVIPPYVSWEFKNLRTKTVLTLSELRHLENWFFSDKILSCFPSFYFRLLLLYPR